MGKQTEKQNTHKTYPPDGSKTMSDSNSGQQYDPLTQCKSI